jgi:hypothetical protein
VDTDAENVLSLSDVSRKSTRRKRLVTTMTSDLRRVHGSEVGRVGQDSGKSERLGVEDQPTWHFYHKRGRTFAPFLIPLPVPTNLIIIASTRLNILSCLIFESCLAAVAVGINLSMEML